MDSNKTLSDEEMLMLTVGLTQEEIDQQKVLYAQIQGHARMAQSSGTRRQQTGGRTASTRSQQEQMQDMLVRFAGQFLLQPDLAHIGEEIRQTLVVDRKALAQIPLATLQRWGLSILWGLFRGTVISEELQAAHDDAFKRMKNDLEPLGKKPNLLPHETAFAKGLLNVIGTAEDITTVFFHLELFSVLKTVIQSVLAVAGAVAPSALSIPLNAPDWQQTLAKLYPHVLKWLQEQQANKEMPASIPTWIGSVGVAALWLLNLSTWKFWALIIASLRYVPHASEGIVPAVSAQMALNAAGRALVSGSWLGLPFNLILFGLAGLTCVVSTKFALAPGYLGEIQKLLAQPTKYMGLIVSELVDVVAHYQGTYNADPGSEYRRQKKELLELIAPLTDNLPREVLQGWIFGVVQQEAMAEEEVREKKRSVLRLLERLWEIQLPLHLGEKGEPIQTLEGEQWLQVIEKIISHILHPRGNDATGFKKDFAKMLWGWVADMYRSPLVQRIKDQYLSSIALTSEALLEAAPLTIVPELEASFIPEASIRAAQNNLATILRGTTWKRWLRAKVENLYCWIAYWEPSALQQLKQAKSEQFYNTLQTVMQRKQHLTISIWGHNPSLELLRSTSIQLNAQSMKVVCKKSMEEKRAQLAEAIVQHQRLCAEITALRAARTYNSAYQTALATEDPAFMQLERNYARASYQLSKKTSLEHIDGVALLRSCSVLSKENECLLGLHVQEMQQKVRALETLKTFEERRNQVLCGITVATKPGVFSVLSQAVVSQARTRIPPSAGTGKWQQGKALLWSLARKTTGAYREQQRDCQKYETDMQAALASVKQGRALEVATAAPTRVIPSL